MSLKNVILKYFNVFVKYGLSNFPYYILIQIPRKSKTFLEPLYLIFIKIQIFKYCEIFHIKISFAAKKKHNHAIKNMY